MAAFADLSLYLMTGAAAILLLLILISFIIHSRRTSRLEKALQTLEQSLMVSSGAYEALQQKTDAALNSLQSLEAQNKELTAQVRELKLKLEQAQAAAKHPPVQAKAPARKAAAPAKFDAASQAETARRLIDDGFSFEEVLKRVSLSESQLRQLFAQRRAQLKPSLAELTQDYPQNTAILKSKSGTVEDHLRSVPEAVPSPQALAVGDPNLNGHKLQSAPQPQAPAVKAPPKVKEEASQELPEPLGFDQKMEQKAQAKPPKPQLVPAQAQTSSSAVAQNIEDPAALGAQLALQIEDRIKNEAAAPKAAAPAPKPPIVKAGANDAKRLAEAMRVFEQSAPVKSEPPEDPLSAALSKVPPPAPRQGDAAPVASFKARNAYGIPSLRRRR